MKQIKYTVEIIMMVSLILTGLFFFAPNIYGNAWELSQNVLPVTERIKQACPSCYLKVQEANLQLGKGKLRTQRERALKLSKMLQERQAAYESKLLMGEAILDEARRQYGENPNAKSYIHCT